MRNPNGASFAPALQDCLLLAFAAHRMGVSGLLGGMILGATLGFLFFLSVDLSFMAMMNFFTSPMGEVVDVLANTAWSAGIWAAVGFMLGRGTKAA